VARDLPTPERLRQLLRYEPETGLLFWLARPREMFSTQRAFSTWNARFAGQQAFNLGCFDTLDSALAARRSAEARLHGEFARAA